jgi:NADPH-dependent curcumin reductase CurA
MRGWEARLAARPAGLPAARDIAVVRAEIGDGIVVRNEVMVLASMTGTLMAGGMPPLPGYEIGATLTGRTLGRVQRSTDPALPEGSLVLHNLGWREYATGPATVFQSVDPAALPDPVAYLSSAFTAYLGLTVAAELRTGDTVYVSSAAGAVGSFAGQIARVLGAGRVIGSASATKLATLTGELRYDVAIDHRDGPLAVRLRDVAPEGIDVYFDNVGGGHLDAAVEVLRAKGRVALCGALSYQTGPVAGPVPATVLAAIGKRLSLRGFTAWDHADRQPEFLKLFGEWLRSGEVRFPYTVVEGLAAAPQALSDLLAGRYSGTVLVRLG